MAPEFSNSIHGFLSPYLQKKKKVLAPEKKGLAPELFLVLSIPACQNVIRNLPFHFRNSLPETDSHNLLL
jgi:hypothetical protein